MALGNHYYLSKDYDSAKFYYERVLKLGPIEDKEGVEVYFKGRGKYRLRANKDFGYFVLAARRLSDIYSKKRKYDRAIDILKSVLRYHLIDDTLYNEIGNNYASKGDLKKAIYYFKKSVEENSKNFWSLNNLGVSYAKLKSFDEAIKWFKKALLVNSRDAYTNYNVGLILILEKRYESGVKYLEKSIKLKGLSPSDRKNAIRLIKKYKKIDKK